MMSLVKESCCWFCPVSLHLSEIAPEACAGRLPSSLGLLWLYYLNACFPVTETWRSSKHQPVLWKPGVVLLNSIFCLRCFFPAFCGKKRFQSACPQGRLNPWLCRWKPSSVSGPFWAQGNTCFACAQIPGWGLLPGFEFGYLVLRNFIIRLFLELEEGTHTHNLLFQRSQGKGFVFSIVLFLLKCLLVYAVKCLLPSVPCHQYVNLFALLLCLRDPLLW